MNGIQLFVCTFVCFLHFLSFSNVDFTRWLNAIHPQSGLYTSHPAHCTSPAVSVRQYLSWPLMLFRQTGPSCLLICLEDLPSAYQSAPPADYLSNRVETKAVKADSVGSDFSTGAGQQCAPSREKVSKCHLRYLLQSTTSNMLIYHSQSLVVFSWLPSRRIQFTFIAICYLV